MNAACGHPPDHVRIRPNGVKECVVCRRRRNRRHRAAQAKPPLVYATRRAVEDAARLLPERPIENVAVEALRAGRLARDPGKHGVAALQLDDRLVATVARTTSPLGRSAWRVLKVTTPDPGVNRNEGAP